MYIVSVRCNVFELLKMNESRTSLLFYCSVNTSAVFVTFIIVWKQKELLLLIHKYICWPGWWSDFTEHSGTHIRYLWCIVSHIILNRRMLGSIFVILMLDCVLTIEKLVFHFGLLYIQVQFSKSGVSLLMLPLAVVLCTSLRIGM